MSLEAGGKSSSILLFMSYVVFLFHRDINQILYDGRFHARLDGTWHNQIHVTAKYLFKVIFCIHEAIKGCTAFKLDQDVHVTFRFCIPTRN